MARVILRSGDVITIGGVSEIFGTSGVQNVSILDGSSITFRSGFNSGGDTIVLNGRASDFVVSISGSNVTLRSAVDNITIVIPIGVVANTITFDNGDSRSLSLVGGIPMLGGQVIPSILNADPAPVTPGPGSIALAGAESVDEGGMVTFTVTRTDAALAETLLFTVGGSTVGGAVGAATSGADFSPASGTISFAAGQTTATFTVAVAADALVEGLEGIEVRVLSGTNVVASASTVIVDGAIVVEPKTIILSADPDLVTPASDNLAQRTTTQGDTIIAGSVQGSGVHTLGAADNIDGGEGDDTLQIVEDRAAGGTLFPRMVNVETVEIQALEAATIDFSNTTGLEILVVDRSVATTTVVNLRDDVDFVFDSTSQTLNAGYSPVSPVAPTTLDIDYIAAQGADLNLTSQGAGVTTLNLDVTGGNTTFSDAANDITGAGVGTGSVRTINLSGDSNIVFANQTAAGNLTTNVNSVDTTGLSGTLNLNLLGQAAANNLTFVGGAGDTRLVVSAGDNSITFGAGDDLLILSSTGLDGDDVIAGGAGENALEVHYNNADTSVLGAMSGTYAALAEADNIQTLVIDVWNQDVGANNPNEDVAVDGSLLGSVSRVVVQDTSEDDLNTPMTPGAGNGNRDDEVGNVTIANASGAVDYEIQANQIGVITAAGSDLDLLLNDVDVDGKTDIDVAGLDLRNLTGAANVTIDNTDATVIDESTNTGFVGTNSYTTTADETDLGDVQLADGGVLNVGGATTRLDVEVISGEDITVDASGLVTGAGTGGIGNNVIDASGALRADVTGTAQNDTILGTADSDSIAAGEGDNEVFAFEGDNTITAGGGDDAIFAGTGNDTVDAGDGDNVVEVSDGDNDVTTGSGDDAIDAVDGDNTIDAGTGNNIITVRDGDNTITSGSGDDTITARDGNNVINAGDGDNTVVARDGNNTVTTGSGQDRVQVGEGLQTIRTGADNDRVVFASLLGNNLTSADLVDGGAGFDTLQLDANNVALADGVFNQIVNVEELDLAGDDALVVFNQIANDRAFNTVTFSGNGSYELEINEGFNRDLTVNLGAGNAFVDIDPQSTTALTINVAADTLDAADVINAGDSDRDAINLETANGTAFLASVDGVETVNIVDSDEATIETTTLVLSGDTDLNLVDGSGVSDNLIIDATGRPSGAGVSQLTINTGSGNDFVAGSDNGDLIDTGAGQDVVDAGSGSDTISTGDGNDVVFGGGGGDTISTGAGDDIVITGDGDDVIDLGGGDDFVLSSQGADVMTGGSGTDRFIYTDLAHSSGLPETIDTIADFTSGEDEVVLSTALLSGRPLVFVGNAANFGAASGAVADGSGQTQAVFQADTNTLWIDLNDDGALNANDLQIVLSGVTSLEAGDVVELPNFPPAPVDDAFGVGEDDGAAALGSVTANDFDFETASVDLDVVAVAGLAANVGAAVAGSDGGLFTINADGTVSFDTNADFEDLAEGETRETAVTYTVEDEGGATSTASVVVTVTGVNDAPIALDDAANATEDGVIVTGSLAGNDDDVDNGAVLTYTAAPVAGLTLNPDGTFSFNPGDMAYQNLGAGDVLDIPVVYTVTDERGASDTATFTITITGVNDDPVAVADTNMVLEDALTGGNVRTNDSDVDDGTVLTYSLNAMVAGLLLNADGTYVFDATDPAYQGLAAGEVLPVVAEYTVSDGEGGTAVSTLTINVTGVNDTPVVADDVNAVNEDAMIMNGDLTAGDSDVDGDPLSYALVGTVAGLTVNSNGTYSFDATDAAYQGLAAGVTTDVVATIDVTDGIDTVQQTLTITVTGVNDAPVAGDDTAMVAEDTMIMGDLGLNDSDVDVGDVLAYTLPVAVAGLTVNADGTYTFDASDPAYQGLAAGDTMDVVATIDVTDGIATVQSTLTITVTGVDDALTVGPVTPGAQNVFLFTATDPDNDIRLVTPVNGSTAIMNGAVTALVAVAQAVATTTLVEVESDGQPGTVEVGNLVQGTVSDDIVSPVVGSLPQLVATFGGNDTVITGMSDDIIWTGTGQDQVRAGMGNDFVNTGGGADLVLDIGGDDVTQTDGGNDTYVLLGNYNTGTYNMAIGDLGNVNTFASNVAGDRVVTGTINLGAGLNDTFVTYGAVDLTGATLAGIESTVFNSSVRINASQLALLGNITFAGGEDHTLIIVDDGAPVDLSLITLEGTGNLDIDTGGAVTMGMVDNQGTGDVRSGTFVTITDIANAQIAGPSLVVDIRDTAMGDPGLDGEALYFQAGPDTGNRLRVPIDVEDIALGNIADITFDLDILQENASTDTPSIRLLVDADGDLSTTDDRVSLVWEEVNQVPAFQNMDFVSAFQDDLSIIDAGGLGEGRFWQSAPSFGNTFNVGDGFIPWSVLSSTEGSDALLNGTGGQTINAESLLLGLEISFGTFNGEMEAFIDDITIEAEDGTVQNFNFEVAEPAVASSEAAVAMAPAFQSGVGRVEMSMDQLTFA